MEGGGNSVDETVQRSPSRAVVESVARAEGVPPEELRPPEYEPLHAVVDPDALDSLFGTRPDGRRRSGGSVSFIYCGYDVTIEANGSVTLESDGGVDPLDG
ncbi:HalOD1 output domain-containing protein [Natrarchaeobius oligotrophus]|uniref:Halobacterial output domain-containing protein n=1 Tax=Natrarchaeobius chitinivorans TaxID=1679083 RepID=A0A3N6PTM7_NATCH|nr:HalOD1 output domain-containing protein [Natrarchaeobius chitinivorans]RQH03036.1 hypothetical protein EA472_00070 [Natrarchaeobius chitinivorans]